MAKPEYSPEDCDLVHEMHQYADDILSVREHCFDETHNDIVCLECGMHCYQTFGGLCDICDLDRKY